MSAVPVAKPASCSPVDGSVPSLSPSCAAAIPADSTNPPMIRSADPTLASTIGAVRTVVQPPTGSIASEGGGGRTWDQEQPGPASIALTATAPRKSSPRLVLFAIRCAAVGTRIDLSVDDVSTARPRTTPRPRPIARPVVRFPSRLERPAVDLQRRRRRTRVFHGLQAAQTTQHDQGSTHGLPAGMRTRTV